MASEEPANPLLTNENAEENFLSCNSLQCIAAQRKTNLYCTVCNKTFNFAANYKKHLQTNAHNMQKQSSITPCTEIGSPNIPSASSSPSNNLTCKRCNKIFKYKTSYEKHIRGCLNCDDTESDTGNQNSKRAHTDHGLRSKRPKTCLSNAENDIIIPPEEASVSQQCVQNHKAALTPSRKNHDERPKPLKIQTSSLTTVTPHPVSSDTNCTFYNLHQHCVAADGAQLAPMSSIYNQRCDVTEGIVQGDEVHNQIVRYLQWLFKVKRIARVNVRGDGNCLFRAYSLAMYGNENQHGLLRQQVVRFMLDNRLKFVGTQFHTETDVMNYIEGITPFGSYAGNLEHLLLSYIFNVNVLLITAMPDGISPTNNRKFYPGVYNPAACQSVLRGQITGGYEKNQAFVNAGAHLILFFHGDVNHSALNHYQCYFALDQQNHLICPCAYDNFFVNPQVPNQQGSGNQPIGDDCIVTHMQELLDWSTDHPESFFVEHANDTSESTTNLPVETVTINHQTEMSTDELPADENENYSVHSPTTNFTNDTDKPRGSYEIIITEFIAQAVDGKLTTQEICDAMENKYPYYKTRPNTKWKNVVQRTLSKKKVFTPNGKFWALKSLKAMSNILSSAEYWNTEQKTTANLGQSYRFARCVTAEAAVLLHSAGPMNLTCRHCNAFHFKGEQVNNHFSTFCANGKVVLDESRVLKPVPKLLQYLLAGTTKECRNFQMYIRKYNNALAFASLRVDFAPRLPGRGPYVFKIHNQMYSRYGALHPDSHEKPTNCQLYMLDSKQAVQERIESQQCDGCLKDVMNQLDEMLRKINKYALTFTSMRDIEKVEEEKATQTKQPQTEYKMVFLNNASTDLRRYNEPTVPQIAAIFVGEDGEPPGNIDFTIFPRGNKIKIMKFTSPNTDPMVFPLLFPHGENGWDPFMSHNEERATSYRNRLTLLEYFSYRLAIRREFSIIHAARDLFQQYLVFAYVQQEGNRLHYIRNHQKDFRVEQYQGLMDYIQSQNKDENISPGRIVILPSSFTGSPRCMMQNYQDAMAIVSKTGKPCYFITFTCNPRWKEITDNLRAGERASDRPDLISRVFHQKLKELLHDVNVKQVLGKVTAYIYAVEFQKRGLPHVHLLLVMAGDDKVKDSETVDAVVSAELPNEQSHPRLFEIVTRHMIHGPCGIINPASPCMADGVCTKKYPREFRDHTLLEEGGYPVYRRRNNGVKATLGDKVVDNTWVVPYNAFLSLKYDAHLNVEICSSIKSVKYLHKYILKGFPGANVVIKQVNQQTQKDAAKKNTGLKVPSAASEVDVELDRPFSDEPRPESCLRDEIAAYLDARYICAHEAHYRISQFTMGDMSHVVIRLAVHLANYQSVYYKRGEEAQALQKATERDTTLTAYFKLNQKDDGNWLYDEVPLHFVFDQKNRTWNKRKQQYRRPIISRMYTVSPADRERYFLRLVLQNVRGAKSFEDLRTVNDVEHATFFAAAEALGLLANDAEWHRCLKEASNFQMPFQLRLLFAIICAMCDVGDALDLFNTFMKDLCEDFARKYQDQTTIVNACLTDIERTLSMHNKTCKIVGLTEPVFMQQLAEQKDYDCLVEQTLGAQKMNLLNDDQRKIANEVLYALREPNTRQRLFFIDGPGGTGKTFLYNTMLHVVRGENRVALPVAFSGIAAILLNGGRTVHSQFGLPVPLLDTSVSNIKPNSRAGQLMRDAELILWDEAPMSSSLTVTAVDTMLKDVTGIKLPFGGKVVVFGGDWRQVLPVVPRGSRVDIVNSCMKSNKLWREIKQLRLRINMRANPSETAFAEWLLKLGNDELPNVEAVSEHAIALPESCLTNSVEDFVFGVNIDPRQMRKFCTRVILCPTNDECNQFNNQILDRIKGTTTVYKSIDTIDNDDEDEQTHYPVEFLNSLTPSGMPYHELRLKQNAIIILLRNLNPQQGLCNGTRLLVRKCCRNLIDAEILTGSRRGQTVFIPRIDLRPTNNSVPCKMKRRQFPVKLAFAMTINKAQGQTFDRVGLSMRNPVFSHGQLYVAFSRVRNLADIKVQITETTRQKIVNNHIVTSNVVYNSIL